MEFDKTMSFEVEREENTKCQEILKDVYQALVEKDIIQLIKLLDTFYQEIQHI